MDLGPDEGFNKLPWLATGFRNES